MIMRAFTDGVDGSEPEYAILNALSTEKIIYNRHLDALNDHFLAVMREFDKGYSETHGLETTDHLRNRQDFAEHVANHLSDLHADTPDNTINLLNTKHEHSSDTGPTLSIAVSTGFNGHKPDIESARSLRP